MFTLCSVFLSCVAAASVKSGVTVSVCSPQDLASADRLKRQVQTERDELQDEINDSNTKKYVAHNQKPFPISFDY